MFVWEYSNEKQSSYYSDILKSIKNGFYRKQGFYVLPYLPEKFRSRVIYFPINPDFEKIYQKHRNEILLLEKKWNEVKEVVEKRLVDLFGIKNKIKIIISPQLTGSLGGHEIYENVIEVRPRFDRKIGSVVMLVVNALTVYFERDLDWQKRHVKTFENYKKINFDNIFSKNRSLLTMLDKSMAGKLAEESQEYLNKMGVNYNNNYDFLKLELTKNEKKVFELFLENQNKLVILEKIGLTIWGERTDEKFSLFAISKLVDRLRKEIKKKTGKNLIHSQRGVGYLLYI
ncbi:MAG: helix-turn-helix domain-containing protein [Candidatus Shapirobacteria bacterium]